MAAILSIETATKVCSVALHEDAGLIASQVYHIQKSHSSLLPGIIDQLLENCEYDISALEAIALSAGPGSYTGLRIGTATAKGLAYALGLPFISVNSLDTMTEQIRRHVRGNALFCPMIDARRMEVYCYLKNTAGDCLWQTTPLVVTPQSFDQFADDTIYFFGDGAAKCREVLQKANHHFIEDITPHAAFMGGLAYEKYLKEEFEDVAYFEPDYLKEYRTINPSAKFRV